MTTDNLPPLPQPEFDNLLDHIYEYGTLAEGTINEVHAHGVKPAAHAQSHLCGSDCAEAAVGGPRCEGPCAVLGLYPMDETAQGVPASRPEGSAPLPTDGSAAEIGKSMETK